MTLAERVAFTSTESGRVQTFPARETMTGSRGLEASSFLARDSWLHEIRIQIGELVLLQEGWDSSVASAISTEAIRVAIECVDLLAEVVQGLRRPFVSPTANGGVNLEWHGIGAHFDLTVEDGTVYAFASAMDIDWEGPIREMPASAIGVLVERFSDE